MKRKLACLAIVLLIAGITLWSNYAVSAFSDRLDSALEQIGQDAAEENWADAASNARRCVSFIHQNDFLLMCFLPHGRFSELAGTVASLEGYAEMELPDLMAESKRARMQLRALNTLFFRSF